VEPGFPARLLAAQGSVQSASQLNAIPLGTSQLLDKYLHCIYIIHMDDIQFEWDDNKNRLNKQKHRVSFEEALTVFSDEHGLLISDPNHSEEEDRFLLLGLSIKLNTLVVCHCYRKSEDVIRIISARKASRKEQQQYWKRWKS